MLENKRINMILSLIIAIALWAFVIGEVNPQASRMYREIPIQLVNEEVLEESDLAVLSVSDMQMTVTVTGTRSQVNEIKEKDIVATVDLSQAAIGENQLRVDVRVPSKVEIESQSLNKVTVVVEEKISKEAEIRVRYRGEFDGEKEPITIAKSLDYVTVTGAATNVERTTYVDAIVGEGKVKDEESVILCNLYPVNQNGTMVYNVDLSQKQIEVTAELATTKTVPLEVPITEADNLEIRRTISVPESITIKGRGADLEDIEKVTAKEINLNNVMENTTISIEPILPENVEVSEESESLLVKVQVSKMKAKTFTFNATDVELKNLAEGFDAKKTANRIQVTVVGTSEQINAIEAEDFILTADLSQMGAGSHTVMLNVECTVTTTEIQVKPKTISVKLTKIEEDDQGDDNNDQDQDNKDQDDSIEEKR